MINELATSTKENTISSREVAEMMGVRHKDLLRKIDGLNNYLLAAEISTNKFWIPSTFENRGKHYREYQVNKKGCELIAHKTEGEKGIIFTAKYMDRLEEMENELQKKLHDNYIEALEQLLASEKEKARVKLNAENY